VQFAEVVRPAPDGVGSVPERRVHELLHRRGLEPVVELGDLEELEAQSRAAEVAGEDSVAVYRSSEWAERAFRGTCGSNLWYRFLPTGSRSFLAGLFDLPPGIGIERQIFVDEKPDWYDILQESPMLTGPECIAEAEAAGFSFG